jgi:hypothetical protein
LPASLEALSVVIFFVVPGYVAAVTVARISASRWPNGYMLLMYTLALGTVNGVGGLVLLRWKWLSPVLSMIAETSRTGQFPTIEEIPYLQLSVLLGLVCYLFPAILGIVIGGIRNSRLSSAVCSLVWHLTGYRTNNEAWDELFDRPDGTPLWVHVYLTDDKTVYEGLTFHVSGYPDPDDMLIEYAKKRTVEKTEWQALDADYVLLDRRSIRSIEAYEPSGLEPSDEANSDS